MKRFNGLILVALTLILVIGLVGCMALSARWITLKEMKESLKNDYSIDIAEIYGGVNDENFNHNYIDANFDVMDEDLANAIKGKLEKWRYNPQGYYCVLYLKTTEGEYKAVYYIDAVLKWTGEGGDKVYGQVKDYLYITDTDFRW